MAHKFIKKTIIPLVIIYIAMTLFNAFAGKGFQNIEHMVSQNIPSSSIIGPAENSFKGGSLTETVNSIFEIKDEVMNILDSSLL